MTTDESPGGSGDPPIESDSADRGGDTAARIASLLETVQRFAALDFSRGVAVGDAGDELDALAAGINMLGEEAEASQRELAQRVEERTSELTALTRRLEAEVDEQRRLAADLAVLSQRFEHQSLHDGLTGLARRELFNQQLERAWAHERRYGRGLVVLVIDLDGFKLVNDSHGHHAGDQLLVAAAKRMRGCVRDSDTLARLGGDEFGIILPEADLAVAREVAERLQHELAAPLAVGGGPQALSASIGIAEVQDRQEGPEDLLREADAAMYAAKAAGMARHEIYGPELEVVPAFRLSDVVPGEAIAWADYMRRLRTEIAEAKLRREISPTSRAPERVHRTLQQVLAAIDELVPETSTAMLVLPPRLDLDEFVFQGTAVHHWADALLARGILTVTRPPEANRFWEHLEHRTVLATGQTSGVARYADKR